MHIIRGRGQGGWYQATALDAKNRLFSLRLYRKEADAVEMACRQERRLHYPVLVVCGALEWLVHSECVTYEEWFGLRYAEGARKVGVLTHRYRAERL
jgi:hypothetical protein